MQRRALLRAIGGLAAGTAAAGCLQDSAPAGGEPGTATSTGTDTVTPTEGGTPTTQQGTAAERETATELTAREFSVRMVGSGSGEHDASAVAADAAVVVTGTIPGANGCYRAELADATLEDGTLSVVVRSFQPDSETATACTQAVVAIDYRARFAFEGGYPDRVRVVHETTGEREVLDRELRTASETETAG